MVGGLLSPENLMADFVAILCLSVMVMVGITVFLLLDHLLSKLFKKGPK